MPELPEVETVRKSLLQRLQNKVITDIDIIYPKVFETNVLEVKKEIINKTIKNINRLGKYLIFDLDDYKLISHLRMEGKYFIKELNEPYHKHDLVVFTINNSFSLRYNDTRKFGKMQFLKKEEESLALKKLGPEPFDKNLTVNYLRIKLKNKSLPIKSILLDQTIISGIGNIYADEILFASGIDPLKKGKALNDKELITIIDNSIIVLNDAIKNGGTTIRSYSSLDGVAGKFQNNLCVHSKEKEPCKKCNSIIKRIKVNGRSTYFCPICQK